MHTKRRFQAFLYEWVTYHKAELVYFVCIFEKRCIQKQDFLFISYVSRYKQDKIDRTHTYEERKFFSFAYPQGSK